MESKFSTSVNILRDSDRDFHYIPTPNAKKVVGQIINDFKIGIRSFNLIGTYGTGKSSFLLAFEQSLKETSQYFKASFLKEQQIEFVKLVGSYNSLISEFAQLLDVDTNKDLNEHVLAELFNRYRKIKGNNKILFILIDEFGKYLEFASKNKPELELYFIQQLAEFCNNPDHNIVLVVTVHQSFESYSYSLNSSQKQEWTKVKGRFREITFNEPVEQLLYLASEHVSETGKSHRKVKEVKECIQIAVKTKAFHFSKELLGDTADRLFPLDILSATVLALSLQRYGQNERSLFSFLESTDETGFLNYKKGENPFYNLSCVFDYLNYNFYTFLTSKYNPDFSSWSNIRSSLDTVERKFDSSINDLSKVIKTVGLLNIFVSNGAIIDKEFLAAYLRITNGLQNANELIDLLERKNVIRYRSHSRRYVLFEGTDLDIQTALIEAGSKISPVIDVSNLLSKYFNFTPVLAKLNSYGTGTPRLFDYIISEYPVEEKVPVGEIDGYVNLIFNSKLKLTELKEVSAKQSEAIVYCYFKNSDEIKALLFEIEKIQKVADDNKDDRVAKRELENIIEAQIRLLNHFVIESIYSGGASVKWYFSGEAIEIRSKKEFNKFLSRVCGRVYYSTPVFKNELVNKHKISSSIHTAKRNYFRALCNNWNLENLGFDERFPPEKTIYLTLIKENGIVVSGSGSQFEDISKNSTFIQLWRASLEFLADTKKDQRRISEFVEVLGKRPFKLKQGLIDFWVATFLFIKRDDYAIFGDGGYIPFLSDDNLELIVKYPQNYSIKAFDIDGVKLDIFNSYRTLLNQAVESKFDNKSFVETVKPFLTFYKQVPEYSKKTNRLSDGAIKVRLAISQSRDPEETFFKAFPSALGVSLSSLHSDHKSFENYTAQLQSAIREIRSCFENLIGRIEEFICNEFVGQDVAFEIYKPLLQKRYENLKKHLLLSSQKTFTNRLDSALDDKRAWLSSMAQALTGKTLELFSDDDEILFYEKFRAMILDLDSLTELSKTDIDELNEEIVSVKIDTFFSSINPKIVRIPKRRSEEVEVLKNQLKKKLNLDKTSNIAAVLKLLKELL
jgi:hypothetical protein